MTGAGRDLTGLSAGTADRARELAAGRLRPAVTRDAATVVLLRDGPACVGVEVYLLRRVPSMAFAPGMHVFPGGSVDPRDADLPDSCWAGPAPAEWARPLTAAVPLARALVCAAVRETFEESGVLLAAGPGGAGGAGSDVSWEADRRALLDRSLSLAGLLGRRGLVLRSDLLCAWSHWVTPEVEPRRYDTRFFVAALPSGQHTRDVGGEADRVRWVAPAQALAERAAGRLEMLAPTAFTLSELSAYPTVAAVLAAGTGRDVRPVLPRVVVADGTEARILLPGDPGYDR